jgi:hypothetical protein
MGYDDYGVGFGYAFFAVYFFVIFLFAIAGYVLSSWFLMKIFDKAGVQGRWRAWVPVYNLLVFAKLGDLSPWVMLGAIVLSLIPGLNYISWIAYVIVGVMAAYRVGLKLQKPWPLLLLGLIPGVGVLIWLAINAFDGSRWNTSIAPAQWAGNSFFADRTVWDGVPVQPNGAGAMPGYGAYGAPQGYQQPGYPAQPGYGAPGQPGYPPQPGYGAPGQPGYAAPQQPGYGVPQAPGAPGPAPAAPGAPVPPPATPPAAPVPPAAPPATPPAPPAPPAGDEPPAAPGQDVEPPAGPTQPPA